MKRIALSLVAWAALSLPANAQSNDLFSWQHWNLNTMSSDEQARINAGLKNGSLTRQEANELQNRLNRINELKGKLGANGLSFGEKKRIDSELDSLAESIYKESKDRDRTNNWLGKKPWDWTRNFGGNRNLQDLTSIRHWNIDRMLSDEQARINSGVRNGSITRQEASRLQTRIDRLNSLKRKFSVNGVTGRELRVLDREQDELAEKIFRESNDGDRSRWLGSNPLDWTKQFLTFNSLSAQRWNFNTMTNDEQARITAGLKNGSLTREEARQLQNRLDEVNRLKAELSRGGLSLSEQKRIDDQLDRLGQDIFRESRDSDTSRWLGNKPWDWTRTWKPQPRNNNNLGNNFYSNQHWNLNVMTTDEQARINAGLRNGTLTKQEASQLQTRLNEVNRLKAQLGNDGLNLEERRRIDAQLDKLGQDIFKESRDVDSNRWLGNKPWDWAPNWKHEARNTNRNQGQVQVNPPVRTPPPAQTNQPSLTQRERRSIEAQEDKLDRSRERMAETGNGVSAKEQRQLDRREDRLNRRINRDRAD